MNKFEFESKYYLKKISFIYILLNICVVIVSVLSLVAIFTKGISIRNISPIIVSMVVSFSIKNKFSKGDYVNSTAIATIYDDFVFIDYGDFSVRFYWDDINELQYSDKLQCVKIVGKYYYCKNAKEKLIEAPYYLYINKNEELLTNIEKMSNLKINNIDI